MSSDQPTPQTQGLRSQAVTDMIIAEAIRHITEAIQDIDDGRKKAAKRDRHDYHGMCSDLDFRSGCAKISLEFALKELNRVTP